MHPVQTIQKPISVIKSPSPFWPMVILVARRGVHRLRPYPLRVTGNLGHMDLRSISVDCRSVVLRPPASHGTPTTHCHSWHDLDSRLNYFNQRERCFKNRWTWCVNCFRRETHEEKPPCTDLLSSPSIATHSKPGEDG